MVVILGVSSVPSFPNVDETGRRTLSQSGRFYHVTNIESTLSINNLYVHNTNNSVPRDG